jgi:hypothetical protein
MLRYNRNTAFNVYRAHRDDALPILLLMKENHQRLHTLERHATDSAPFGTRDAADAFAAAEDWSRLAAVAVSMSA